MFGMDYLRNCRGNFATIFAVTSAAMTISVGAAVDFTRLNATKSKMQDCLDTSLLGAVSQKYQEDSANQVNSSDKDRELILKAQGSTISASNSDLHTLSQQLYRTACSEGSLTEFKVSKSSGSLEISGIATHQLGLEFGKILGFNRKPVAVSSTVKAGLSVSHVRIRPTRADGWWNKHVKVFVVSEPGSDPVEVVSASYYSGLSDIDFRSISYPIGTPEWQEEYQRLQDQRASEPSRSFIVSSNDWVELGEYSYAYLEFDVDEYGKQYNRWCNDCSDKGLYRSDDPQWSHRLRINGVPVEPGRKIDLSAAVLCEGNTNHDWEDGGGHVPDFFYSIEARCGTVNTQTAYIAR